MAEFPTLVSVPFADPIAEDIQFKTLVSTFDDLGVEKRKQKWLYPKRLISLTYKGISKAQAATLYQFYIARAGSYEAFNFFYPETKSTNTYVTEYVGTGDGATIVFNLPSRTASAYTLYLDAAAQTAGGTDWTFASQGGADSADKCTFVAAPNDGQRITFTFTGYLKVRCRFEDDKLSFENFHDRLINGGLKLQGLLNE